MLLTSSDGKEMPLTKKSRPRVVRVGGGKSGIGFLLRARLIQDRRAKVGREKYYEKIQY
jgi:hypothetical protein